MEYPASFNDDDNLGKAQRDYDAASPSEGGECRECRLGGLKKGLGYGLDDYIFDTLGAQGLFPAEIEAFRLEMREELANLVDAMSERVAFGWEGPWVPCQRHNPGWED